MRNARTYKVEPSGKAQDAVPALSTASTGLDLLYPRKRLTLTTRGAGAGGRGCLSRPLPSDAQVAHGLHDEGLVASPAGLAHVRLEVAAELDLAAERPGPVVDQDQVRVLRIQPDPRPCRSPRRAAGQPLTPLSLRPAMGAGAMRAGGEEGQEGGRDGLRYLRTVDTRRFGRCSGRGLDPLRRAARRRGPYEGAQG
jgi:hypothetical protein